MSATTLTVESDLLPDETLVEWARRHRPARRSRRRRILARLRSVVVLLALLLALVATPAQATPPRIPVPSGVTVRYAPCPTLPTAAACAYSDQVRIAAGGYGAACTNRRGCVYLDTDRSAFARYHELGHVWEGRTLTADDRRWFTWALGFDDGTPWRWSVPGISPVEKLANTYAACALGDDGENWLARPDAAQWENVGDVSRPRRRALCHAIMVRG